MKTSWTNGDYYIELRKDLNGVAIGCRSSNPHLAGGRSWSYHEILTNSRPQKEIVKNFDQQVLKELMNVVKQYNSRL